MMESFKNKGEYKKPETGNFEVSSEGKLLEVDGENFKEIVKENKVSKKEQIDSILESLHIETREEIKDALKDPESFEIHIDELLMENDKGAMKDYLDTSIEELILIKTSIEKERENLLNYRLDLKDGDNIEENEEVKRRLEGKIYWLDLYIKRAEGLLDYSKKEVTKYL